MTDGVTPESFPDVDSLRRASGAFWQEISRLEGLTKSGQKIRLYGLIGNTELPADSTSRPAEIPACMSGAAVDAEIVVQPDGKTIDVDLAYRFRSATDTRLEG